MSQNGHNLVPMKEDEPDSLADFTKEATILEVLNLMLYGRSTTGKKITIEAACKQAGISYSTWKRWVEEGAHLSPLRKVRRAFDTVWISRAIQMHEGLVDSFFAIAMGQKPKGATYNYTPGPSLQLNALKFYFEKVGVVAPDAQQSSVSEMEHAKKFQPSELFDARTIQINIEDSNFDFIFRGSEDKPRSFIDVTPEEE